MEVTHEEAYLAKIKNISEMYDMALGFVKSKYSMESTSEQEKMAQFFMLAESLDAVSDNLSKIYARLYNIEMRMFSMNIKL